MAFRQGRGGMTAARPQTRRMPLSDGEFERQLMLEEEEGRAGMQTGRAVGGVSSASPMPNRVSGALHPPLSDEAYARKLAEEERRATQRMWQPSDRADGRVFTWAERRGENEDIPKRALPWTIPDEPSNKEEMIRLLPDRVTPINRGLCHI